MCLWSWKPAHLWPASPTSGKQTRASPVTYSGRGHTSKFTLPIFLLSAMHNAVGRFRVLAPTRQTVPLLAIQTPSTQIAPKLPQATSTLQRLHPDPSLPTYFTRTYTHFLSFQPAESSTPHAGLPPPCATPPAASATTSVPWASTPYVTAVPRRRAPS